jgi:putative inorganic carbon (hco3(-)) transporter
MASLSRTLESAASPGPARRARAGTTDAFALAMSLPLAAISSERFRRVMTAAAIIDTSLQIDINFRYNDLYAALGAFGGYNLSVTTFALLGIYLSLALDWVTRPWQALHIRCGRAAVAFVIVSALSLLVARNVELAAAELFLLVQMFLLYLYIASSTHTREQLRWVFVALLIGALLQVGLFAVLVASGHSIILPGFDARLDTSGPAGFRVGGSIGSPNNAGAFFAFMTVMAVAVFLQHADRNLRRLALLTILGGLICLLLTFSRGAWIAFVCGMIILLAVHFRAKRRSILVAFGIVAGLAATVVAGSEQVRSRIFADDRGAAYARIPLMKMAGQVIGDHPVFGVGMNNYPVVVNQYARTFAGEWVSSVHNKYLLVWAETGTLGFIAFVCFVGGTLHSAWKSWKSSDRVLSSYAGALFAGFIVLSLHMCFDLFRGRPVVQLLWIAAALVMATGQMQIQNVVVGRRRG